MACRIKNANLHLLNYFVVTSVQFDLFIDHQVAAFPHVLSTLPFQRNYKCMIFYSGSKSTMSSSFIIAILVQESQQYCFNN